jgi:hypothetical protein
MKVVGCKGSWGRVTTVGGRAAMEILLVLSRRNILSTRTRRTYGEWHYAQLIELWILAEGGDADEDSASPHQRSSRLPKSAIPLTQLPE